MTILIPFDRLSLGGHQTLIVRLANWLVSNGHSVILLLEEHAELDCTLLPSVDVIYSGTNPVRFLSFCWPVSSIPRAHSCDVIFAVGAYSIQMANALLRHAGKNAKLVFGMYHPRGFFRYTTWNFSSWAGERIFSLLPCRNILFMTNFYKHNHEQHYGRDFKESMVIPLPLEDKGQRRHFIRAKTDIIVSIGRLTAFKTYNLYMIDIVSRLIADGLAVEWHVYGTGALAPAMEQRISQLGVEKHVYLHGDIPYEKMNSALDNATAFIGLGTAVIEAGLYGIPCIPAVSYSNGDVYGPLHEQPRFYMGGRQVDIDPGVSTERVLRDILNSDSAEYTRMCSETRIYCEDFLIDRIGHQYIEWFSRADLAHIPKWSLFINHLFCFLAQTWFWTRSQILNSLFFIVKFLLTEKTHARLRAVYHKIRCRIERREHSA